MLEKKTFRLRRWHVLSLLALMLALALSATGAFASIPKGSESGAIAPTIADSKNSARPEAVDAFTFLQPNITDVPGTCPAPPNGGTTVVGCTFALNMMVDAGTNIAPDGLTAQQSYLTFTHQVVNVTRKLVSDPLVTCVPTNTVLTDLTVFDAPLQNQVCNSQPGGCVFSGVPIGNGSIAYASGALTNCPNGCPDPGLPPPQDQPVFRVGMVPMCALGQGLVTLHWQFNDVTTCPSHGPPAPITRDTELVSFSGSIVSSCALYTDYTFTVVGLTSTPTNTPLPTNTFTPVPPTPTSTPQPNPNTCLLADHYFVPVATYGSISCDQPTQHCTGTVGSRVELDLMIHPPAGGDPAGLTAQQAYIDFNNGTNDYLRVKHARVSDLGTTCTITSVVTPDLSVFDAPLQNEVCNDQPGGCVFRGVPTANGSFAYASGALALPPYTGAADFRIAQTGWCLTDVGTATLRWQFAPPDPITRDTEIVDNNGVLVQDRLCYVNFTFTIVTGVTDTPTRTPTNTPVVLTNTPSRTPSITNTPIVPTVTRTPTRTSVPTFTRTSTPTQTFTDTPGPSSTRTPTRTTTNTPLPPTATLTRTTTNTPLPPTATPTRTITNTPAPPTATPTRTFTGLPTNTRTFTPPPTSTNTRTFTPTRTFTNTPTNTFTPGSVTPTPECTRCHLHVEHMTLDCNPDGTLHWTARIKNDDRCSRTEHWIATLQVKRHDIGDDHWMNEQSQDGFVFLPGKEKVQVSGDFCHHFTDEHEEVRVVFKIDSPEEHCHPHKKSRVRHLHDCDVNPTCPPTFPDVPNDSTFYNEIMNLKVAGAVSGYGDGTFRPNANINRGQVAKMVVIAFGVANTGGSDQHFRDVAVGSTYYSYIEAAYSRGLVSGYDDGTFRPYDSVTRGQVAKVVVQAAGYELVSPAKPSFSDVPTDHTFYKYIETAYANSILSGYGDGTFRPENAATRAQVSKIVSLPLAEPDEPDEPE